MVVAANPLAAEVGRQILRQGGSAVDAAIAVQMVLTLVEPQSSGIGGGAFLVHYAAEARKVETFDGRETAPAGATPEMFLDAEGKPLPFARAAQGGHAVGVPGVVRMLALAHEQHGRLPWLRLFEPAMRMAAEGFPISPRLHQLIGETPQLKEFPATRNYFYDVDGNPKAVGTRLANPELAETLRVIANGGANAFYNGGLARAMAKAVRETRPARSASTTSKTTKPSSASPCAAAIASTRSAAWVRPRRAGWRSPRSSPCSKNSTCARWRPIRLRPCTHSPRPSASLSPTARAIWPTWISSKCRSTSCSTVAISPRARA